MLDRIKHLEQIARILEPTPAERERVRGCVVKYSEDFIERIYEIPAFVTTGDQGKGIFDSPISEDPVDIAEAIRLLAHNVDRPALNPASYGHLGYIPGGGIYYASLGDYLADIFNRYSGVHFASPGAVHLENMLLQWMAETVGYPKNAGGNLTSGGSIANLIGVVAARDASGLKAKDYDRSVIYLTAQAHHSVDKAIRIAGLKECILRYVPVDAKYRMDVSALERQITEDKKNTLFPFLVIAAAGTTDVGAVDPLPDIASIAQHHGLWFHIDAAYGGFFILCDEGKKILKGIGQSDSLVMDPHKGLFLPYGSGAVLVKKKKKLFDSFWYQANYLQDAFRDDTERSSPADLSPELTKHFRGLRLWLPLKLLGLAPFRAAIEEKLLLARYFYEKLRHVPGFEVGHYPDLSVVTYRYLPQKGDPNEFNRRLQQEVQNDGRIFISSTLLDGKFTLRLAILAFRTHLATIEMALSILKEKAAFIEQNQ